MYTYSFVKTVNDLQQLELVIKDTLPNLQYSVYTGNEVDVYFNQELTNTEQQALTQIVANFVEFKRTENLCQTIMYLPMTFSDDTWLLLSSWVFPGITNLETLACNVHSYLINAPNIDSDSYDLRVYDAYNNKIIGQVTLSNTICQENVISFNRQLLPGTLTLFELHGKLANSNLECKVQSACVLSL